MNLVLALYRPVGLEELCLVVDASMRAFPARLPDQPIFYPVTNQGYAAQIAREWNTVSGTLAGFVLRFAINQGYARRFERRVVGAREHEELWVPAEQLSEFNSHIVGTIDVVGAYFGEGYLGQRGRGSSLRGNNAREQLRYLVELGEDRATLADVIRDDYCALFANFLFWQLTDFSAAGISPSARDAALTRLRTTWELVGSEGLSLANLGIY